MLPWFKRTRKKGGAINFLGKHGLNAVKSADVNSPDVVPRTGLSKAGEPEFHISNWDSALKRKNALLGGAPLGFVQDQLWAGLARSLVGARLLLALGLTHAQWGTLIRAGLARRSARLGSVRVLARYPTRLGSRLHSRLGSAWLRSGLIRFGLGRYSRLCSAQLEAGL